MGPVGRLGWMLSGGDAPHSSPSMSTLEFKGRAFLPDVTTPPSRGQTKSIPCWFLQTTPAFY